MMKDRLKTNFLTELRPQGVCVCVCVCVCVLVGGLHFCVHGDDPNYNLHTDQNGQAEGEGERTWGC